MTRVQAWMSGKHGRRTCVSVAAALFLGSTASCSVAQTTAPEGNDRIDILPVRENIYMLVGAGGNVTVQVGEQGVLVVDTKQEGASDELLAAIRSLTDRPIRHVINTHAHPDHVGGNAAVAQAGDSLFNRSAEDAGAPVYAHENVLTALSAREPAVPFEAWPSSTYFTASKDLYFNGEAIRLLHQPNSHTNGDSIVYFRRSDVISTGDIFITTGYPYIDVQNGGTLRGIIDALNRIIELAVPEALQEGGTVIIPGHGRLCDESEVVEYRDMLTIIRSIIRERINEGMSLEEVLAARPTAGFDVRYGADSGFWTTTQFVEAVYNELINEQE